MDSEEEALAIRLGYPVVVAGGAARRAAALARRHGRNHAVVCDAQPDVVAIARGVARRLGVEPIALPLGERRKRLATLERTLDAVLAQGLERGGTVVGVGGGVAGDLFGFAAATYMRGVGYIHVATTLVAMVDAAIGGKTGVDLRGGKNLVGAFSDPLGVFCDLAALHTLPTRAIREGLAEVVKVATIAGDPFFARLETLAERPFERWPWREVVLSAVRVKADIVAEDRRELGVRELLNLGHTFAHGIERASGYRVSHGAAVAIGLRAAGLLAQRAVGFRAVEQARLERLLARLHLAQTTTIAPEAILEAMTADKKRRDGKLRFVLPRAIGDATFGAICSSRAVTAALRALAHPPQRAR